MRYSEKKFDIEVENPIALIIMICYTLVSSPTRLMSEIAKKIIFLGESASKFFLVSVVLNTIVMCLVVVSNVFITKKINLISGRLSLVSLAISLAFTVVLYLLFSKYKVDFNEESQVEEIDEEEEDVKEIDGGMEKLLADLQMLESTDDNVTLTNRLEEMDGDDSRITDSELSSIIDSMEKTKIDSIYGEEFENKYRGMEKYFNNEEETDMSDLERKERDYLADTSDVDSMMETLGLPTEIEDIFNYENEEEGSAMVEEVNKRVQNNRHGKESIVELLNI